MQYLLVGPFPKSVGDMEAAVSRCSMGYQKNFSDSPFPELRVEGRDGGCSRPIIHVAQMITMVEEKSLVGQRSAIRGTDVRKGNYLQGHPDNVEPVEVFTPYVGINKGFHQVAVSFAK